MAWPSLAPAGPRHLPHLSLEDPVRGPAWAEEGRPPRCQFPSKALEREEGSGVCVLKVRTGAVGCGCL